MNKRIEDQLARLAFGELSEREEAELRRACECDPEARKALDQYQTIRHGLKLLPVTPHQLSTERLNEAILRQGLRNPSEPSPWRWLSAPTWAAATVLAIWGAWSIYGAGSFESGPAGKPLAVRSNLSEGTSPNSGMESNLENTLVQAELSAPDAGPVETGSVALTNGAKASPQPPAVAERSARVAKHTPAAPADLVYAVDQLSIDVIESAIVSAADAASWDSSEPLVIIDEARDETTGASRAKEVTSVSNVVVGG